MNILQKLGSLTRGTARERAEVIIDKNGHTIMEQEIVEIERSIMIHKSSLAELLASKSQLVRESDTVKVLIKKRENQAKRLTCDKVDSNLMVDIIKDIADQEVILEGLSQSSAAVESRILKLESFLNKAVLATGNYRRELRVARAQRLNGRSMPMQACLSQRLSQLKETHARLVSVQEHHEDLDEAWGEMESRVGGKGIESRLEMLDQSDHQIRIQKIHKRLDIGLEKI